MKPEERNRAKLEQCRPYYRWLVELRPALSKPDADFVVWGATDRYLQLAIECAIDVGEMVISWRGWERPEENRDVFRVLATEGMITQDLASRLVKAAGLRNLLVHQYGALDREKLRRAVLHDLGGLEEFSRNVARAVGRSD